MSGSSGGGYSGGSENYSPCESLRFDANLTSPKPSVVGTLKVGAVLTIVVAEMKDVIVLQVLAGGLVVGGLTALEAARLRTCIDQGHTYQATVLSLDGGQVRVRVMHTP